MRPARLVAAPLVVGVLVALGACSSQDGRELPEPDPGSTTSTSTSTSVPSLDSGGEGVVTEVFTLYSTSVVDGGSIPERATCDGEDLSPPLDWVGTPPAAELAIVVRDRDADGFVHWVLTGIDPAIHGLGEGGIPESAVEAQNGFGRLGWSGPCPPEGSGLHTYEIALHALPEPLVMPPGTPAEEAAGLVESASTARAVLTVTAER